MNIDLKYRVWDVLTKKMFSHSYIMNTLSFSSLSDDNMVFMPWIGIKDKRSIEIYEGDVILQFGQLVVVQYFKGAFGYFDNPKKVNASFIAYSTHIWLRYDDIKAHELEVMGNIYEHTWNTNKFNKLLCGIH